MKICNKIEESNVRRMAPELFKALDKHPEYNPVTDPLPEDLTYCFKCDGIRIKIHECICWVCGDGTCETCLKEEGITDISCPMFQSVDVDSENAGIVFQMHRFCNNRCKSRKKSLKFILKEVI